MTTHKANSGPQASKETTGNPTSTAEKPSILQPGAHAAKAPNAISLTGSNAAAKITPVLAAINPTSQTTSTAAIATRFAASNAASSPASADLKIASPLKSAASVAPSAATKQEAMKTSIEKSQETSKSQVDPGAATKAPQAQLEKPLMQKNDAKKSTTKVKAAEKTTSTKSASAKITSPKPALKNPSPAKTAPAKSGDQAKLEGQPGSTTTAPLAAARAGLMQARLGYEAIQEQKDFWTKGLMSNLAMASHGAAVLHGKVFDLFRNQTNSTIDLWQRLLEADSMAEAVTLQTSELRRQFEASSHQLKDIAQTTNRLLTEALTSNLNKCD